MALQLLQEPQEGPSQARPSPPPSPAFTVTPEQLDKSSGNVLSVVQDEARKLVVQAWLNSPETAAMSPLGRHVAARAIIQQFGTPTDWAAAYDLLDDTYRTEVKTAYRRWMDQDNQVYGEGLSAFGSIPHGQRAEILGDLLSRDDEVSQTVEGFFLPSMGPDAQSAVAQIRSKQRQAVATQEFGQMGPVAGRELYGRLYQEAERKAVYGPPDEAANLATGLRLRVEEEATKAGVPFQAWTQQPLDLVVTNRLLLDTRDLMESIWTKEAGGKASRLILGPMEDARVQAIRQLADAMAKVDLSGLDGDVEHRKLLLADLLRVVTEETRLTAEGMQGRVDTPGWLLKLLMRGTTTVGSFLDSIVPGVTPKAYIFPDGGVYLDPLLAWQRAESDLRTRSGAVWKTDPDWERIQLRNDEEMQAKFVGERPFLTAPISNISGRAAAIPLLLQEARMLLRGDVPGQPVKPVILTGSTDTGGTLAQAFTAAGHGLVTGDGVTIFEAMQRRMTAGMAPDDRLGRFTAGIMALGADLGADPLNWLGAGFLRAGTATDRYIALVRRLEKAGIEVSAEAATAGVKTVRELVEATRTAERPARTATVVKLADGTKLNASFIPAYTALTKMFGGDEGIARALLQGFKADPSWLSQGFSASLKDPSYQFRYWRMLNKAGIAAATPEEAALLLNKMVQPISAMLKSGTEWNWLGRLHGLVRGANEQARHGLMFEHARGLYLSRLGVGTPILTDPIWRAVEQAGRWGRTAIQAAEKLTGHAPLSRFAEGVQAARRLVRSGFHVDTVWTEAGAMRVPYGLNEQMRQRRMQWSGAEGFRRGLQAGQDLQGSWMLDEKTMRSISYEQAVDLATAADGAVGATSDEMWRAAVQHLAFSRAVEPWMPVLKNLLKKGGSEALDLKMAEIAAAITPKQIAAAERSVAGLRGNFDRLQALVHPETGVLPALGRRFGLFDARDAYAPRLYKGLAGKTLAQWQAEGPDAALSAFRGSSASAKGSPHNWKRTGPPTLIEARIYGLDPVLDLRVAMEERIGALVGDAIEAEALEGVARQFGMVAVRDRTALLRLVSEEPEAQLAFEARISRLKDQANQFSVRAKALQDEWKAMAKEREAWSDAVEPVWKPSQPAKLSATHWKGAEPAKWSTRLVFPPAMQDEIDAYLKRNALRREAVERFAQDFDMSMEQVERIVESSAADERVRLWGQLAHAKAELKKATAPPWIIPVREHQRGWSRKIADIHADLKAYSEFNRKMKALGIGSGDRAAALMELYGVPSIYLLPPETARAFVEHGMVRLDDYLKNPLGAGRTIFDDPAAAFKAYKGDRAADRYFIRLIQQGGKNQLSRRLASVHIPVELALMMQSYGVKIGVAEKAAGAAMFEASRNWAIRAWDWVQRNYKYNITVRGGAINYGRRNQFDAFNKLFMHSGMRTLSPAAWQEFGSWLRGELPLIEQAGGGAMNGLDALEHYRRTLTQTFEMPLDVLRPLREEATVATGAQQLEAAPGLKNPEYSETAAGGVPKKPAIDVSRFFKGTIIETLDALKEGGALRPNEEALYAELRGVFSRFGMNPKISLVDKLPGNQNPKATGSFNLATGEIDILAQKVTSHELLSRLVSHEAVHAATSYAIEMTSYYPHGIRFKNVPLDVWRKATRARIELDSIHKAARLAAGERGLEFYGLENLHDFVAEAFSNVKFQKFLASVPSKSGGIAKQLFTAFVEAVRNMLGMSGRTALDDILKRGAELMEQNKAIGDRKEITGSIWKENPYVLLLEKEATAATEQALGQKVGTRTARAARAMSGSQARGVNVWSSVSTGGRMPRWAEMLFPVGPQASEAMDNMTRAWIYFHEIKAGRSIEQASFRAGDLARNWTNLAPLERYVISRFGILFYNFHKQNLKSLGMFLAENPARAAWLPKLKEAIEADLPDEIRPQWANAWDTILGRNGAWYFSQDMGGLQVLDGMATVLNAGARGRPLEPAARHATAEGVQQMTPLAQALFGDMMRGGGRLRLPQATAARMYDAMGRQHWEIPGLGTDIADLKLGPNGAPILELSRAGQALSLFIPMNQIANSLGGPFRRAELGQAEQAWIQAFGLGRYYDYTTNAEEFTRGAAKEVDTRILEAFYELSDSSWQTGQLKELVGPEALMVLETIAMDQEAFHQIVGAVRDALGMVNPAETRIPVEVPRK